MPVRTVTVTTGSTAVTLVAGQTSPLTTDEGGVLTDDVGEPLTLTYPAVHATTVEVS